jgi:hypothetical protein
MSVQTRRYLGAAALVLSAALSAVGVATHASAHASTTHVLAGGGDHYPDLHALGL